MATFTSSGWPAGATVNAFARDAYGNATGAAVGGSPQTASSAGQVTFTGLADSSGYVASDGSRTVNFRTPPVSAGTGSGPATLTYDGQGRLSGVTAPGSTITAVTYDSQGRMSGFTENGTARTLTYDGSTGALTGIS